MVVIIRLEATTVFRLVLAHSGAVLRLASIPRAQATLSAFQYCTLATATPKLVPSGTHASDVIDRHLSDVQCRLPVAYPVIPHRFVQLFQFFICHGSFEPDIELCFVNLQQLSQLIRCARLLQAGFPDFSQEECIEAKIGELVTDSITVRPRCFGCHHTSIVGVWGIDLLQDSRLQ